MADVIEWEARFATGMELVDSQHESLVRILNHLYREIGEGCGEAALQGVFGRLQRYALHHFGTEERILRRHGPVAGHAAAHLAAHEEYRRRIADLSSRHENGEKLVPIQVLAFVGEWWLKHIASEDRVFARLAERETQ